jgi:GNAT superfamily N-acetyltransferase
MATLANPSTAPKITLAPMNLHNPTEFDELLRQRVLCGWEYSPADLEGWRAAADAKKIAVFWIVPGSMTQLAAPQRYAGHISMQDRNEPPNDVRVRHIFILFVLPEQRCGGLGKAAMQALEATARDGAGGGSPECRAMALNALSRRYVEDDGEEWRGLYAKVCAGLGLEMPAKGTSNENWYAKMGYVKWKEEPSYPVTADGKDILLIAASLRKELV